ncbi:MAG: hypothetical protein WD059_08890 [Balneolaceae bacterium]
MKTILLLIAAMLLVLVFTSVLVAQGIPPMLPGAPDQAPIDGGLGILAAAGGAYAYKKLRKRE